MVMTTVVFAYLTKRYGRRALVAWIAWEAAGMVATVAGGLYAGQVGGLL
jgi:hypothetical protein